MSVDTTVKKVSGRASPHGDMDQTYLISGKRVSLRPWRNEKPQTKPATKREYETVGYMLSGRAELTVPAVAEKLPSLARPSGSSGERVCTPSAP